MPTEIYHLFHFAGIILIFTSYGLLIARSALDASNRSLRKLGSITSGIGLLSLLFGGFGLLAKLYSGEFPGWFLAKLIIWFALGGLIAAINRKPKLSIPLFWVTILLGITASILGIWKPF